MLRLERLLLARAQLHHRRHVDFVEGREHRGGLLRFDETPRDRRAALRHAHALLDAPVITRRRRGTRRRGRSLTRSGRRRGRGLTGRGRRRRTCGCWCRVDICRHGRRRGFLDVVLRHPRPVGFHGANLDVLLARELARRGRRRRRFDCPAGAAFGSGRGAGAGSVPEPAVAPFVGAIFGGAFLDRPEHVADLHVGAVRVRDALEHAGLRRRHFDVHLVRLELDERLAGGHRRRLPSSASARRARPRWTRRLRERR